MNNTTHFKSINQLFSLLAMVSILFFSSCGGDDEATPDCNSLVLTANAEGNTITVSATGGEGPYVFSLNGAAQQGTTFIDLEPDTYEVSVTDANECTDSETLTITDPCVGFTFTTSGAGYAVAVEIEEGDAPFSYEITYGNATEEGTSDERSFTVDLDEAEETTITITDANGCEEQSTMTAEQVKSFTDSRDGQTYQTIKIGEQIWFAENFNYETEENSYCYDNDPANCEVYGRLYTWEVSQNLAPTGWELPSASDYQVLIEEFGGGSSAIAALEVGGSSRFEFKLGGRYRNGAFVQLNDTGQIWTSDQSNDNPSNGISFAIVPSVDLIEISTTTEKLRGCSVRFLKSN